MTKILPFKGIIYNQEKIKDLSRVVCPPYDVISPAAQERYMEADPYNLIHVLLSKDVAKGNKYRSAGKDFRSWLKNKILIQEERPAIYFYSQQYNIQGEKKTRLGFISLLHLAENNSGVFRHEHTRREPKEDRLRLLKQVKANLSPIFAIFLDNKRIIQRTYQQHIKDNKPFIDLVDDEKTVHKLWKIDSPQILEAIQKSVAAEDIFIADGHHRYEVACVYRDMRREKLAGRFTGEESFNFIMAYFTNTDPRGLTILSTHRLLKLGSSTDIKKLLLSIGEYFDVEEVKEKTKFFFLMEKGGRTENLLGMYKDRRYYLLRLKNIRILDKMIHDKPKSYRSLDVCILNSIIFDKILGLGPKEKENLRFSQQASEFIEEVDSDPLCIAFFLNSVKIQQIISVSKDAERMPPKSTYFYPKVLSGLVINKLD